MAFGLKCWNANGIPTLEITDRLSRMVTMFTIPTNVNSGSVYLGDYISGDVWASFLGQELHTGTEARYTPICSYTYSISGNTLNWSRTVRSGETVKLPVTAFVGIY